MTFPTCAVAPGMCVELEEYGLNITDRWHTFHHTLFSVVTTSLFVIALRKLHPRIAPRFLRRA